MDGDGGDSASGTPWDLGMHWAPTCTSAYPQHFMAPPPVGSSERQQELTSLKLGKQPSCLAVAGRGQEVQGEACQLNGLGAAVEGKRKDKTAAVAVAVARCQVEGCHLTLATAKEYHRRHKVCEAHSKAPRVVVHGAEQRFCQQCSRFHVISEFDDAKRSCRRRLAGHNERRRKSNASEAMVRSSAHHHGVTSTLVHGFLPHGTGLPTPAAGALSLLSSARSGAASWMIPTPDMFTGRSSSAALDELIAENRAALLASHFFPERSAGHPVLPPADQVSSAWHTGNSGADQHQAPPSGHVTLDLMQAATTEGAAFQTTAPVDGDVGACSSDAWTPPEAGAHGA